MTKPPKTIDELRKALPERERRVIPAEVGSIEYRASEGEDPKIGMFTPYHRWSVEMYGFREQLAPGVFARSLKNSKGAKRSDVVALWNHDPAWVLGRQSNRTLTFTDGEDGLRSEATLDGEDAMHRHFARRVERRDVQGSSFGFETVKDEWVYNEDGTAERTLLEVKLFDVSPVTYPAYPDSEAEKRERRSVIDIAAVKAGVDLNELAAVLGGAQGGKVQPEQRDLLAVWVAKLEAFLPPAPAPEVDWAAKLALRARAMKVGA